MIFSIQLPSHLKVHKLKQNFSRVVTKYIKGLLWFESLIRILKCIFLVKITYFYWRAKRNALLLKTWEKKICLYFSVVSPLNLGSKFKQVLFQREWRCVVLYWCAKHWFFWTFRSQNVKIKWTFRCFFQAVSLACAYSRLSDAHILLLWHVLMTGAVITGTLTQCASFWEGC